MYLHSLGNIKKIIPATWYYFVLTIVVGIFGAFTMLTTFACVMFMPVSIDYNSESFHTVKFNDKLHLRYLHKIATIDH